MYLTEYFQLSLVFPIHTDLYENTFFFKTFEYLNTPYSLNIDHIIEVVLYLNTMAPKRHISVTVNRFMLCQNSIFPQLTDLCYQNKTMSIKINVQPMGIFLSAIKVQLEF